MVYGPRIYRLYLTKDFPPELGLFLYGKPSKVVKMESHLVIHLMNHLLYWKESGYTKSGWSLSTKNISFALKKNVWKRGTDFHHSLDSGCGHPGVGFSFFFFFCLRGVSTYVSLPDSEPLSNELPLCVQFSFLCNLNYFLLSPWGVSAKLTTYSPRTSRKVGSRLWATSTFAPGKRSSSITYLPVLPVIAYINPWENEETEKGETGEIWNWEEV